MGVQPQVRQAPACPWNKPPAPAPGAPQRLNPKGHWDLLPNRQRMGQAQQQKEAQERKRPEVSKRSSKGLDLCQLGGGDLGRGPGLAAAQLHLPGGLPRSHASGCHLGMALRSSNQKCQVQFPNCRGCPVPTVSKGGLRAPNSKLIGETRSTNSTDQKWSCKCSDGVQRRTDAVWTAVETTSGLSCTTNCHRRAAA